MEPEQSRIDAVFVDVGGVLLVPHPEPVCAALAAAGIRVPPGRVALAHYHGVRALDEIDGPGEERDVYMSSFLRALGVPEARMDEAMRALRPAWVGRNREIWRDPVPGSCEALRRLAERGFKLGIVSNADGTVEEQLLSLGVCQVGAGSGAMVAAIVDSFILGTAKPDPAIFHHAAALLGVEPRRAIHVGDSVRYDVQGARAAGVHPIHVDPYDLCVRPEGHDHVRNLAEVERYLRADDRDGMRLLAGDYGRDDRDGLKDV
jgi:putative hydrolase of the HAD superfamily